jgi:RNAse (barnase) inhibitor barstar
MAPAAIKPVIEIDGDCFDDLVGFYEHVSERLIPGARWGGNLDAFNDILRGGFGTPEGGFVLRWRNTARARRVLGHEETARWLRAGLTRIHPTNLPEWRRRIELADAGAGQTLIDVLVEIIQTHAPGGQEQEDGVELVLED